MTSSTPFDPAQPTERGGRGRGRTLALVGGILGIVAVGAGATFAFQRVGGGGAQPESALPSTVAAFVKVDLDPSAGQKLDAVRFLRKFPDARARVAEDADLRKVVFDLVKESGDLDGVDYAKDVEPWLGHRAALGMIPAADGKGDPVEVLALAVSDEGAATQHLPAVAKAMDGACQVVAEFALCTETAEQLSAVVAAQGKGTLADAAAFEADVAGLGEDGIATGWVDTSKVTDLVPGLDPMALAGIAPPGTGAGAIGQAGRYAVALRFDGPHLELAGHLSDAKTKFVGSGTASSLGDLPDDTLAALSVANAGDQVEAGWPALEDAISELGGAFGAGDPVAEAEQQLGISLPDDLVKALGSQLTVAFGGLGTDTDEIKLAVMTDGDEAAFRRLTDGFGQGMGAGGLAVTTVDGRTVASLSDGWADAVAAGGDLGGTAKFEDAVRDLDSARVAAYVDIAGLVEAFGDDLPADEAKNFAPLGSVGLTVSGEGSSADFAVRLTTR